MLSASRLTSIVWPHHTVRAFPVSSFARVLFFSQLQLRLPQPCAVPAQENPSIDLGPRAGDIVASIEDLVFAAASVMVFLGPQPPPMPIAPPPTPTPEPSPVGGRVVRVDEIGGIFNGMPSPSTSPVVAVGDGGGSGGGGGGVAGDGAVVGLVPATAGRRGADGPSGATGRRHSSPMDVPWSSMPPVVESGLTDGLLSLGEVCMKLSPMGCLDLGCVEFFVKRRENCQLIPVACGSMGFVTYLGF